MGLGLWKSEDKHQMRLPLHPHIEGWRKVFFQLKLVFVLGNHLDCHCCKMKDNKKLSWNEVLGCDAIIGKSFPFQSVTLLRKSKIAFASHHRKMKRNEQAKLRVWTHFQAEAKKGKGDWPERWEIVKVCLVSVCMRVNVTSTIVPCKCVLWRWKIHHFSIREIPSRNHIALEYSHFLRVFNSNNKKNNKFSIAQDGCWAFSVCMCDGDLTVWHTTSFTCKLLEFMKNSGTFDAQCVCGGAPWLRIFTFWKPIFAWIFPSAWFTFKQLNIK